MKILIIGDWHSKIHEEALKNGFIKLGHQVVEFKWFSYFKVNNKLKLFLLKLQNKFLFGPVINLIQKDIIHLAEIEQPDVIFIYRGTHIFASTLDKLKKTLKTKIIVYNNDDPFSEKQSSYYWRHFIQSLKFSDLALAYRHHNMKDFTQNGAVKVGLLRSWFIPEKDFPVAKDLIEEQFIHDVVFVGHYENDGRNKLFEYLLDNGIRLKIYGPEWNKHISQFTKLQSLLPTHSLNGLDYNKVISGSKITICILSKLNRDTYTRRCFEIPAIQGFMLAEYTEDLASLFSEDNQVAFFRNKEELLSKIKFFLENESKRQIIAENGFKAVYAGKHDNTSRAQEVIEHIHGLRDVL